MPEATFILSLDTEIAWGTYDAPGTKAHAFDAYAALLRRLINLLDIYEIPATWAVVGALVAPENHDPGLQPVQYSFASEPDIARCERGPSAWFHMPAVLDAILSMRVPQEIATHTYTHLLADDPNVTRARFAADIAAVIDLHQTLGLPPPRSIVYPRNRVAHLDVLSEHSLTAYRGPAPDWYSGLPTALRRPAHLLDRALALPPPVDPPHLVGDVVNVPASQFLMSYDGIRAKIPTEARVRQAMSGLDRATAHGTPFHLWFHPFNLGSSDAMVEALTEILALVYERRAAGTLHTVTMAQAAEIIRQSS